MRVGSPSTVALLAFALVAAVGMFLAVWGGGREEVVYEAEVPDWSWRGAGFQDQFVALLMSDLDLRRAQAALPGSVWAQAGPEIQEHLAKGDTAVIIAYLGEAPTGGYAIRVRRVTVQWPEEGTDDEPVVTIAVARRRPTPDEFVIQAFTYPYDVVAVPKSKLPEEPFQTRFIDDEGRPLDDGASPTLKWLRRRFFD